MRDVAFVATSSVRSVRPSCEVFEIGRGLAFLGRHQEAVRADHVVLLAEPDLLVAFLADIFGPERLRAAVVGPMHRPRPGERVVDHRDVVVHEVTVGLVEVDALLDDGLVVLVERDARAVIGARAAAGRGSRPPARRTAVAVFVEPAADRIALRTTA